MSRVSYSRSAFRALSRLPTDARQSICETVEQLAAEGPPGPNTATSRPHVRLLSQTRWSHSVGDGLRVVCERRGEDIVILAIQGVGEAPAGDRLAAMNKL